MGEEKFLTKLKPLKNKGEFDRNLDVLIALLPAAIAGCIYFSGHAMFMILSCMAAAVIGAFLAGKLLVIEEDPRDLSAAVCGMLVAMTMPSGFSIPAAAVCAAAGVIVPRMMFGGAGCEIVSPAAFGAIMAFLCFPNLFYYNEAFTNLYTNYIPFSADLTLKQLLFGAHAGAIGETPAVFLCVGAVYLIIRRIITPIVPLCAVGFTALWSLVFGMDILPAILGGGVLLAAIFMLSERSLCPHGVMGKIVYSAVFAFLTVVIRKYAAVDEGVYFAVLTVQLVRPLFDAIPDMKRRIKTDEQA